MKVVIYGNRRQHPNGEQVRNLVLGLVMSGAHVCMHDKLYDHLTVDLGVRLPGVERVFECPSATGLAVSIGGDGTLLRTVAWLGSRDIPVLGVNTGHLGYLTALTLAEAVDRIDDIVAVNFRRESLSMLRVEAPGIAGSSLALNEVVVAKEDSASMISAEARLNGSLLADYRADGLIVATPTGSTAYNLSVGGPIVEPTAPVWVLSPIAAHSLTLRPLVVGDSAEIEITVNGRGSRFRLVLDGRASSLPMGSAVRIRKADHRVALLYPTDRDFARIIGTKLLFNG